jgi:hypothetical protein
MEAWLFVCPLNGTIQYNQSKPPSDNTPTSTVNLDDGTTFLLG